MVIGLVLEMGVPGLDVEIVVDSLEIKTVGHKDVYDLFLFIHFLNLLYLRIRDDSLIINAKVLLI